MPPSTTEANRRPSADRANPRSLATNHADPSLAGAERCLLSVETETWRMSSSSAGVAGLRVYRSIAMPANWSASVRPGPTFVAINSTAPKWRGSIGSSRPSSTSGLRRTVRMSACIEGLRGTHRVQTRPEIDACRLVLGACQ